MFKTMGRLSKATFIFLMTGVALSCFTALAWANHLVIENFEAYEMNQANNTITFTCDVSWENSWRNATNQDAVWIFLKYSTDGGTTWSHASMSASGTNPMGFNAPNNFEVIVPGDETGFFLQRTDLNSSNVTAQGLRFVWDYAQDGLSDEVALAANTVNKIFGVEMVYVPQGAFYAGDGSSSSDYHFVQGSADLDPWYIENENSINVTNAASDGYYYQSSGASGEDNNGAIFLLPTSFPKGFGAFYMMKYELTENQWVGFFNTLTNAQKLKRDITSGVEGGKGSDAIVNRNTVSWDDSNVLNHATTSRPERPVSYISWPDMLAYADWAGLRPLTELEFEKAARGTDILPVANEFAWGKATSNDAEAGEIFPDADENGTEQIFDGAANLNRNSLSWTSGDGRVGGAAEGQRGPLRVGIFAENSTSRITSGGGFYGNMELSGNLYELVVSTGNAAGRQFLGTHGDGELSFINGFEGNATNTDWPGIDPTDSARGVIGTVGSGYRGGDFQSDNVRHFQASTRLNAAKNPDSEGANQRFDATLGIYQGGRLARTAP